MENESHYLQEPIPDSISGEVEVVSPEQNARDLAIERVNSARGNLDYIEEMVAQSDEDEADFGVKVDKTVAALVGEAVNQGTLGINIESTVDVGVMEVAKEGDQKETAAVLDDAPLEVLSEAMRSAMGGGIDIEEVSREIDGARERKLQKERITNTFADFIKEPGYVDGQGAADLINEAVENPTTLKLIHEIGTDAKTSDWDKVAATNMLKVAGEVKLSHVSRPQWGLEGVVEKTPEEQRATEEAIVFAKEVDALAKDIVNNSELLKTADYKTGERGFLSKYGKLKDNFSVEEVVLLTKLHFDEGGVVPEVSDSLEILTQYQESSEQLQKYFHKTNGSSMDSRGRENIFKLDKYIRESAQGLEETEKEEVVEKIGNFMTRWGDVEGYDVRIAALDEMVDRGADALSVIKFFKNPAELERVGREASSEGLELIAVLAKHSELDFDKSSDLITGLLNQEDALAYQGAIELFDQRVDRILETGYPAEGLARFIESSISPYNNHHMQFDHFERIAKERAVEEYERNTPYPGDEELEDTQDYGESKLDEYCSKRNLVRLKAHSTLSKKEKLDILWSIKFDVVEGIGEDQEEICQLIGEGLDGIEYDISKSILYEELGYEHLSVDQIKEYSKNLVRDLTEFSIERPEEYGELRGARRYKWNSVREPGIFEEYERIIEFGEAAHSLRLNINQDSDVIAAYEAMRILDKKTRLEGRERKVSETLDLQIDLFKDLSANTDLDKKFLIKYLIESEYNAATKYAEIFNTEEGANLFSDGSILYPMRAQLLGQLSGEEQYESTLKSFYLLSKGNTPLWRLSAGMAELRLKGIEHGSMSTYSIDSIPVSLPNNRQAYDLELDSEDQVFKSINDMSQEERRMYMSQDAAEKVESGEKLGFNELNETTRLTLLSRRLFEAIGKSRSTAFQAEADRRNRGRFASEEGPWSSEGLVHATGSIEAFRQILNTGMMCGETIGLEGEKDRYPYNVDLVAMSQDVLGQKGFSEKVGALKNSRYGNILMSLYRGEGSTDHLEDTQGGMNADHRLIFGGVPATEIESIILRDAAEQEKISVINSVVENDFYVPIYDTDGTLLLSPSQYDELREDGNLNAVKPEVLDTSYKKENTQAGSNEGAWYIIPNSNQAEDWYVKFGDASLEKTAHVWNELLADSLYREVMPEVSPETKAVVIKGRFARASKVVDLDSSRSVTNEARNQAAIMDMYLGNWDAVFNKENLVMSAEGYAMRIDTGNALDFRARGGRKHEGAFGSVVTEIEEGDDANRLGQGMRQMYPGLTDDMVKEQIQSLSNKLDDDTIDRLVDGIRRSGADRDFLKTTLKARRDYLAQKFLQPLAR